MLKYKYQKKGLTAIVLVITIGAIGLLVAGSGIRFGLTRPDLAFKQIQGGQAQAIVEACAEEVLRRWQIDSSYSAVNKIITIGEGSCTYSTARNGNTRSANIHGQVNDFHKRMDISLEVSDKQNKLIDFFGVE